MLKHFLFNQVQIMIAFLCIHIVYKVMGYRLCVFIVKKHNHQAINVLEPYMVHVSTQRSEEMCDHKQHIGYFDLVCLQYLNGTLIYYRKLELI
jgi:hypothetical protein